MQPWKHTNGHLKEYDGDEMKKTKTFKEDVYDRKKELIIYGASVYGELAYYALKRIGISPSYFCDRAIDQEQYFGIPVIRPAEMVTHRGAAVIIASSDYFHEIRRQLNEMGCHDLYDMEYLLQIQLDIESLSARAADFYDKKQDYIDIVNSYDNNDDLNFPRIQFVVTSGCSLKCRDCISLMQYYKKTENVDLEKYKKGFLRLLKCVTNIFDFRILGGEPFVHREMYKIIEWFHDEEKIKRISVFTNGTIIPPVVTLNQLKREKVRVHISDYGFNRDSIEKLVNILKQNEITYYVQPYDYWQDAGNLVKRNYENQTKIEIFGRCYERECFSYYNGRLYHCPRAAHGINLGVMPDSKSEYVDLMDESIDDEEIIKQLRFQRERNFIEACDYCNGADSHRMKIEPAIQIDHVKHIME